MIRKLLMKVVMFGFVAAGLSIYAGYLITGRMPTFVGGLQGFLPASGPESQSNWTDIGALEHKKSEPAGGYEIMQGGKTVIYKWQDANGRWQYGERAPTNISTTRVEIATAPAVSATPGAESAPKEKQGAQTSSNSAMINPYSPEGVKQLMDKAHDVQRMMNERNDQLDKK